MSLYTDYNEGSLVVCTTDLLKNLKKGEIYQIQKVQLSYGLANKIKLVGIPGYYSYWNFRVGGKEVERNSALCDLLDIEPEITKSKIQGRKIDNVENKTHVLFELILQRMRREWVSDRNSKFKKSGMDGLIERVISSDRIYSIEEKDFDEIRKMTLEDVISMYMKSS